MNSNVNSVERALLAVALLFCAGITTSVQAQKLWRMLLHNDSLLYSRYHRSTIDTMYMERPQTRWTVAGRVNMSGAKIKVDWTEDDRHFRSEMESAQKTTLCLAVSYLGISLSLALNPAKMMGKYSDYELNFNSYGKRFGFDFIYQNAHDFTGWHEADGSPRIDLPADMLKVKTLNVNAYYVFNSRKFSYPAAFTQSYIQKKSAGSVLLAVSGQGQHTETNGDYVSHLKVTNIGVGGGYGYNWVPGRHWLLHLSAMPTFTLYSNTTLKVNDERVPLDYHFPEVIITSRGSVVRQLGNVFIGASMVYNFTNIGAAEKLSVHNTKWRGRLFAGVRLW